jgi:hypothetical protein
MSFRLHDRRPDERKETPLMRLSAPELAKLLEHRREHILMSLTDRQQMSPQGAKKNLENVIGLLGLFDHLTLSQHGNASQASWSIRLTPAHSAR